MVDKGFSNLAKDIDSARKYCNAVTPRLIDHFEDRAQYLKEKTADMRLSDKTQETIDKVCENFEWNEVTQAESMSADRVRGCRKNIDAPEAERDWYKCDRQAAKDMREFCDYESKESETIVSRKMLHVPEVAEDDKDLEL